MNYVRQFSAFSSIVWQNTLAYRAENVIWLLVESLPIVVQLSLWRSLYIAGRIPLEQMQFMMLYYVLALIIARSTGNHFEEWVIDHIRNGNISTDLIKPFPYRLFLFANETVWRVSGWLYTFPILMLISPFFLSALHRLSISPLYAGLFAFVIVLAFLQRFFVSWLIAISAFWIEQADAFTHLKWMLEGIVGGQWLPLAFYPLAFQHIAMWTPFYAWYALPIGIMLNTVALPEIQRGIIAGIGWLLVFILAGKYLWKKAILFYSASGG